MKLAIHNASRVWGGNEKWLATVAAGLRDRGHEVVVACRRSGPVRERLERLGVRTTGIRPHGELDLVRGLRFATWLRREHPDAMLDTSWSRVPWVSRAARWAGVRRVVVRLGVVRALPPFGRYARAFLRRVDAMIVNSEEIRREWLRSAPSFPAGAVHVIYNGVRTPAPAPRELRARIRAELGVPDGAPLLVGVGHVYRRKGFDLLISALAALPTREVHLAIVGTGAQEAELREQADRMGVGGRVHWAGFRDDVPGVVSACDVFVLSSRQEGMANVMLEAMAVGTPVVATAVSGVAYALSAEPGAPPAGWIVPPEDPAALAATIEAVLRALRTDSGEVAARVEEAGRRVLERFGPERMVDEVERVLCG